VLNESQAWAGVAATCQISCDSSGATDGSKSSRKSPISLSGAPVILSGTKNHSASGGGAQGGAKVTDLLKSL
jgi:hypothetical protein